MSSPLRQTFARPLVRRNLAVAAVVGTVLNLINQGDALVSGGDLSVVKMALTYCVPFCVASYGTYNSLRHFVRPRPPPAAGD